MQTTLLVPSVALRAAGTKVVGQNPTSMASSECPTIHYVAGILSQKALFGGGGSCHGRVGDSASLFFQLHPTLIEGVDFLLSCFDLSIHLVSPMRAFERGVLQGIF